jgi:hypothetical protein
VPGMKRPRLVIGLACLGVVGLLVAVNTYVHRTGSSQGEGRGVISDPASAGQPKKHPATWTETERQAVDKITFSYAEVQKAETILSENTPETLTLEDLRSVVNAFDRALSLAESVPDDVLDKLHPDMKEQFRQIYQAGLLRMLTGFRNADQNSAREGADLYQRYSAWVSSHTDELSFPTK